MDYFHHRVRITAEALYFYNVFVIMQMHQCIIQCLEKKVYSILGITLTNLDVVL